MTDAEQPDGYWRVVAPVWEVIDIYNGAERFLATYGNASIAEQTLFAAHFCESEVSNGGLHQFFSNPTGVLAPEAAFAYRRLGFPDAAGVLEEAMAFFGQPYPRERDVRLERLESISGKTREEWDPFFRLDDRFYAAVGHASTRLFDAMDGYASAGSDGAV